TVPAAARAPSASGFAPGRSLTDGRGSDAGQRTVKRTCACARRHACTTDAGTGTRRTPAPIPVIRAPAAEQTAVKAAAANPATTRVVGRADIRRLPLCSVPPERLPAQPTIATDPATASSALTVPETSLGATAAP